MTGRYRIRKTWRPLYDGNRKYRLFEYRKFYFCAVSTWYVETRGAFIELFLAPLPCWKAMLFSNIVCVKTLQSVCVELRICLVKTMSFSNLQNVRLFFTRDYNFVIHCVSAYWKLWTFSGAQKWSVMGSLIWSFGYFPRVNFHFYMKS